MSLGNIILGAWNLGDPNHLPISFPEGLTGSSGIASAEAFGSGGLVLADQTISGVSGISSAEAFGVAELGRQYLSGAGIASSEAFGATGGALARGLGGVSGIVSAEAFGAGGKVAGPITGTAGIGTAEAFGEGGSLSSGTVTGSSGIASGEAFGAGGTVGSVGGPCVGIVGIPSAEAFGVFGRVAGPVTGTAGIPSAEVFGTTGDIQVRIRGVSGILSAEAFGSVGGRLLSGIAGLLGIESAEVFGRGGAVLGLSTLSTNFGVFIGGNSVTQYLQVGTLSADRQLNFQAACSFSFLIADGSGYFPPEGAEVVIFFYDGETQTWRRIFGGSVDSTSGLRYGGRTDIIQYQVNCVDYAKAMSRRLVTMKFPNATFGDVSSIMEWLEEQYFIPEGLTWERTTDPGIDIADIEFSAIPLNEVLDRLGELTDQQWQVDFQRRVRLAAQPAEDTSAPFDITEETDGNNARTWVDLEVERTRGLYRNKQTVKGDVSRRTQSYTEVYPVGLNSVVNDGEYPQRYFDGYLLRDDRYDFRVSRIVSMTLNDTTPLVFWTQWDTPGGAGGTPPANWDYMQVVGNEIEFVWNLVGKWGLQPTTGDYVTIVFETTSDLPPAVTVQNDAEIAARRAVEGGTGIYEAVEETSGIDDPDLLVQIGEQLLSRFGVMGKEASFKTYRFGLEPGMAITCDLPSLGFNDVAMNVERVAYSEDDKRRLIHQVTISNQVQQRDALAAFQRLIRRIRKPAPRQRLHITFTLAETIDGLTNPGLIAGSNKSAEYLLRRSFTVDEAALYFKTPPTGDDIVIGIRSDNVSILDPNNPLTFPVGATDTITYTTFLNGPLTLPKGSRLSVDVIQAGTIEPGKDGTLVLSGYI